MRELSISIYFSKLKLILKISQIKVADAPGSENGRRGDWNWNIQPPNHSSVWIFQYYSLIVLIGEECGISNKHGGWNGSGG